MPKTIPAWVRKTLADMLQWRQARLAIMTDPVEGSESKAARNAQPVRAEVAALRFAVDALAHIEDDDVHIRHVATVADLEFATAKIIGQRKAIADLQERVNQLSRAMRDAGLILPPNHKRTSEDDVFALSVEYGGTPDDERDRIAIQMLISAVPPGATTRKPAAPRQKIIRYHDLKFEGDVMIRRGEHLSKFLMLYKQG